MQLFLGLLFCFFFVLVGKFQSSLSSAKPADKHLYFSSYFYDHFYHRHHPSPSSPPSFSPRCVIEDKTKTGSHQR